MTPKKNSFIQKFLPSVFLENIPFLRTWVLFFLLLNLFFSGCSPSATEQEAAEQWFSKGMDATLADQKILCFSRTLELNPRHSKAYLFRSLAYREKKEFQKEKKDYQMYRKLRGY